MTSEQQTEVIDEAPQFVCPINYLLDILSAKWTVEILRELFIQPVRSRRFLRLIPGLNMKTLRQRLQMLEDNGLINRTVFDDRPLRVEYGLTAKGKEIYQVLVSIKILASKWLNKSCQCMFESVESRQESNGCPQRC